MLFGETIDWVVRTTKRPDKRQSIKDAINGAISFFTLGASFAQDHSEGTVTISGTVYAQSLDIPTYFPRLRRFTYLKLPGTRWYITQMPPDKIFDKHGCEQVNRWYRSGNNIVFKTNLLSTSLDYGMFQYPAMLVADAATHWMLDTVPVMIHAKACAEIFDGIGEPSESKRYDGIAMGLYVTAKGDFEDAATPKAA